jgi:HNH endonuclease
VGAAERRAASERRYVGNRTQAEWEAFKASIPEGSTTIVPAESTEEYVTRMRRELTEQMRWRIFKRDGKVCQWCGSDERLTVDHIFPLNLRGTNDESNLTTLCRSCNSRKGARP